MTHLEKILDTKILMAHQRDKLMKFLEDESLLDGFERSVNDYINYFETDEDKIEDLEGEISDLDDDVSRKDDEIEKLEKEIEELKNNKNK